MMKNLLQLLVAVFVLSATSCGIDSKDQININDSQRQALQELFTSVESWQADIQGSSYYDAPADYQLAVDQGYIDPCAPPSESQYISENPEIIDNMQAFVGELGFDDISELHDRVVTLGHALKTIVTDRGLSKEEEYDFFIRLTAQEFTTTALGEQATCCQDAMGLFTLRAYRSGVFYGDTYNFTKDQPTANGVGDFCGRSSAMYRVYEVIRSMDKCIGR